MSKDSEKEDIGFWDDVIPKLREYIEEKIKTEPRADNLSHSEPHQRQETLNRLKNNDGFCSAYTLMMLTGVQLNQLPEDKDQKTVRDDHASLVESLELIAKYDYILPRPTVQITAKYHQACERIIQNIISIQIPIDEQKSVTIFPKLPRDPDYYKLVEFAVPNGDKPSQFAHLEMEMQFTGFCTSKAELKNFFSFLPPNRIFNIKMHDATETGDGHTIGVLRMQEKGRTVYHFVDQNDKALSRKFNSLEEVIDAVWSSAGEVGYDRSSGFKLNCKYLKLNHPKLPDEKIIYPEKIELLKKVHVPGREILAANYAIAKNDIASAEFYMEIEKQKASSLLFDEDEEDLELVLQSLLSKFSFYPGFDGNVKIEKIDLLSVNDLNNIFNEIKVGIRIEPDQKGGGFIVNNVNKDSLRKCYENSEKFKNYFRVSAEKAAPKLSSFPSMLLLTSQKRTEVNVHHTAAIQQGLG